MTDDFYALLDVPTDASEDEVKEAFRDKVTEYHPDHNDDPRANAQFTALKKAYDTLGDPVERQAYDRLGHEEYVAKRLDGLPDADQWSPIREGDAAEREDRSMGLSKDSPGGSSASDRSTSSRRSSTGSGSSSRGSSGSSSRRASGSSDRSSRSGGSSTAGTSSNATGRSSGTGSTSRRSSSTGGSSTNRSSSTGGSSTNRSSSSTGGSSTNRSSSSGTTSSSGAGAGNPSASASTTRTRRSETASDGAGTTNPSRARAATASTGRSTEGTATRETGSRTVLERLGSYRIARFLLGWPLVYFASGLYFAGFVGYAMQRRGAVRAFLEGLIAAGTDPGAILTALQTRGGLDPIGPTVAEGITASDPAAVVLLIGIVGFPTVLLVLVRLTRLSPGWKPTYMYVAAALGPLAGVGYGLATTPSMLAELALFVGAPILTLGVLLGYAKIRPRLQGLTGT